MKLYTTAVPRTALSLLVASAALSTASPVISQEAITLEEVVITARKRSESLQDAPLTVSAFSKESLEKYNTDRMEDLASLTPGLAISNSASASPLISLRGINTSPTNPSADQSVALVFDGVAVNHGSIARVSQVDMQQVEILKGPQALFYGKNSPGGVISFTTADPGDEFEASIKTGYEFEADEHYTEAVISGPITDTLGGRLVVNYSDMEGWVSNYAVGNPAPGFETSRTSAKMPEGDELFVRGTLVFEPTDALRMRTKLSYNELQQTPYSNLTQNVFCSFGTSLLSGEECDADDRAGATTIAQRLVDAVPGIKSQNPFYREEWLMASHQIDFQLNDTVEITSVTGYLDAETNTNFEVLLGSAGGFGTDNDLFIESFSQEFRFNTSFDGAVNFAGGVYYADAENTSVIRAFIMSELNPMLPPGLVIPFQPNDPFYTVESEALSVFGEVIWDISDTLQLSTGVRWSDETKEFKAKENGVAVTNLVDELDFTNTSPEATLSWRPTENATYYASYKEGFKSGGHNNTLVPGGIGAIAPAIFDSSFNEETVDGFEVGAKWDLLDGRARVNVAAYYYEIQDMQLSSFDGETIAQKITNAGAATTKGAEIDIVYLPEIEGLTLSLGAAYNKGEFDEFEAACYGIQTAAEGCVTFDEGLPSEREGQDLSGAPLLYAPEWALNASVNYEHQMENGWFLTTALSVEYSDDYITQQEQRPTSEQDSYTRVNANMTLAVNEHMAFSLIGVNLTDEYLLGSGFDATFTGGLDQAASVTRGRQVSLQAKWTF